jgi:hypothetical protein
MERSEFRSFAIRLFGGSALIALSGLLAFIRSRYEWLDTLVAVLFLGQFLFAFAGLALFLWAIGSIFCGDLKGLVDWASKD